LIRLPCITYRYEVRGWVKPDAEAGSIPDADPQFSAPGYSIFSYFKVSKQKTRTAGSSAEGIYDNAVAPVPVGYGYAAPPAPVVYSGPATYYAPRTYYEPRAVYAAPTGYYGYHSYRGHREYRRGW
jgi:hypothetical protein